MEHTALKDFCTWHWVTSLINKLNSWKNFPKPLCVNLVLTNYPKYFKSSNTIETGLFEFHEMVVLITKTTIHRLELKIINWRKYKHYSSNTFRDIFLEL